MYHFIIIKTNSTLIAYLLNPAPGLKWLKGRWWSFSSPPDVERGPLPPRLWSSPACPSQWCAVRWLSVFLVSLRLQVSTRVPVWVVCCQTYAGHVRTKYFSKFNFWYIDFWCIRSFTHFFLVYSDCFSKNILKPIEFSYQVINDETLGNLHAKVALTNFSNVIDEKDIDNAVLFFHENLLQIYNECCPIKKKSISIKDQLKSWINTQFKSLIKRR